MNKVYGLLLASAALLVTGCAQQVSSQNTAQAAPTAAPAPAASNDLVPPNAKPGECYARVLVPATYKTVQEKVVRSEAGEKVSVVPATYKTASKKVLVRAESYKLVPVPATYKTVAQKVMITPEKVKLVSVPATYKTVTEKVLVKAGYTTWKKGEGTARTLDGRTKVNNSTGEIMCLVEVPPVYKTVTKKVMVTPPTTKEVKTPAVYKTVNVREVATAATIKKVVIPAVYKTIEVREVATPAATKKSVIPATYQTVTKRVKVTDSYLQWAPILCNTNSNVATVKKVQQKLQSLGYKVGPIDGIYGGQTRSAVNAYQKDKGLSTGGLTLETVRSLGFTK
jgi:regulator of extracellular matrix RemA (YlzA/DUF370 family)